MILFSYIAANVRLPHLMTLKQITQDYSSCITDYPGEEATFDKTLALLKNYFEVQK